MRFLTRAAAALITVVAASACGGATAASEHIPESLVVVSPAPDPRNPSFILQYPELMRVGDRNDRNLDEELWDIPDAVFFRAIGLIAGMQTGEVVKHYDATGRYLRTIGKKGFGPGEYAWVSRITILSTGDIVLHDTGSNRIHVFDSVGGYQRTIPYPPEARGARRICCFDDGSYLLRQRTTAALADTARASRETMDLSIVTAADAWRQPKQFSTVDWQDPPVPYDAPDVRGWIQSPYERTASVVVAANRIIYGIPDRYEFRVFDSTGALVHVARVEQPADAVSRALHSRVWSHVEAAARRDSVSDKRIAAMREAFDDIWHHDLTLPAFGSILGDEDGFVWVSNYHLPGSSDNSWARFAPDGRLEGTLVIPSHLEVLRFSDGHVIVRNPEDNDGFTSISVYRVLRLNGEPLG